MTVPWTAVIPLRSGSKGLPGKNIRPLAGKPLYLHTVDQAIDAGATKIIITTDILNLPLLPENEIIQQVRRPLELAGDAIPMAPVLNHALRNESCTGPVVLLQVTSPLRNSDDIRKGLTIFNQGNCELLISVTSADRSILKWGLLEGSRFKPVSRSEYCFSNRQNLPEVVRPNGAMYIMDATWFIEKGDFTTEKISVIKMPPERSLDIDTLEDFQRCEAALNQGKG